MSDTKKQVSRTTIQQSVRKPVQEALSALDLPHDPEHLRRVCRALATLGMQGLLDAGAPASYVASQLLEALGHELERRKQVAATAIVAQA